MSLRDSLGRPRSATRPEPTAFSCTALCVAFAFMCTSGTPSEPFLRPCTARLPPEPVRLACRQQAHGQIRRLAREQDEDPLRDHQRHSEGRHRPKVLAHHQDQLAGLHRGSVAATFKGHWNNIRADCRSLYRLQAAFPRRKAERPARSSRRPAFTLWSCPVSAVPSREQSSTC